MSCKGVITSQATTLCPAVPPAFASSWPALNKPSSDTSEAGSEASESPQSLIASAAPESAAVDELFQVGAAMGCFTAEIWQ